MHRELARKGVNLTLLWSEYCTDCYTNGDIPYMYSQFCDKYRQWARISKATMRIQHKPGDVMQVDWAGETIPIYDQAGGETPAYIFVAVLPCSCYYNTFLYFNPHGKSPPQIEKQKSITIRPG